MTDEPEYEVYIPVMVRMTESGVMLGLEINFEDTPWPRDVETVFHNGTWIQGWSIEDRAVRQFEPWLNLINNILVLQSLQQRP
jgi:hypothetical protein